MITGEMKNKVDSIWDTMWTGGITSPITVLEQITYLMFMKLLDDNQLKAEANANVLGVPLKNKVFKPPWGHDDLGEYLYCAEELDSLPLSEMGPVVAMRDPYDPYVERIYQNPYFNGISVIGSFREYLMGHYFNDYKICIGLQLEPMLQKDYLRKCGVCFSQSQEDILYELMMCSMYRLPLSEFNMKLKEYGLPPLSKCVDELDG